MAFGTISMESGPILCNIKESNGLDLDISVTCSVTYEYGIYNMTAFASSYGIGAKRDLEALEGQLRDESDLSLLVEFASITQAGISYEQLCKSGDTVAEMLEMSLNSSFKAEKGVCISNTKVSDIKATAEYEKMLSLFCAPGGGMEPTLEKEQSSNSRYQSANSQIQPEKSQWMCLCGKISDGNFCPDCGKKRPEKPIEVWRCMKCGSVNNGKFCTECGAAFESTN